MKKKSLLILLFSTVYLFSQKSNSLLSSGEWYKFSIDTTGVFKIDANFLDDIGVNIKSINPKNIKIYGNGGRLLPELVSEFRYDDLQENAIYVEGENDNEFNADDFILFYGVGPHSWSTDIINETANHVQNIYSETSNYSL